MKEFILILTNCGERVFIVAQDKIGLIMKQLPVDSEAVADRLNELYVASTSVVYSMPLDGLTGLICS